MLDHAHVLKVCQHSSLPFLMTSSSWVCNTGLAALLRRTYRIRFTYILLGDCHRRRHHTIDVCSGYHRRPPRVTAPHPAGVPCADADKGRAAQHSQIVGSILGDLLIVLPKIMLTLIGAVDHAIPLAVLQPKKRS